MLLPAFARFYFFPLHTFVMASSPPSPSRTPLPQLQEYTTTDHDDHPSRSHFSEGFALNLRNFPAHTPLLPSLSPFAEESDPFLVPSSPHTTSRFTEYTLPSPSSRPPPPYRTASTSSVYSISDGRSSSCGSGSPSNSPILTRRNSLLRFPHVINSTKQIAATTLSRSLRMKLYFAGLLLLMCLSCLMMDESNATAALIRAASSDSFRSTSAKPWMWNVPTSGLDLEPQPDSLSDSQGVTTTDVPIKDGTQTDTFLDSGADIRVEPDYQVVESVVIESISESPEESTSLAPSKDLSTGAAASSVDRHPFIDPGMIPINVRLDTVEDYPATDERFLGFMPHSGFHNQRMALQNALMLGKALNRTVLIPPVWVGWPTPTQHYDDLAASWTTAMLLNPGSFDSIPVDSELNLPATYRSTLGEYAFPTSQADDPERIAAQELHQQEVAAKWKAMGYEVRLDGFPITNLTAKDCKSYSPECRHTYKDSFLSWSSLVNLSALQGQVKTRDRWDMRERAIEEMLGVAPDDVYILKDRQSYDFKFVEDDHPEGRLLIFDENETNHWARRVSIPRLRDLPYKVLLAGSMFGSGRVMLKDKETMYEDEGMFARAMAFRTRELLDPANEIRDRLGGHAAYFGLHARVGDGEFARHAKMNMEKMWKRLMAALGVEEELMERLWESVRPISEEEAEELTTDRRRSRSGTIPLARLRKRKHTSSASQPSDRKTIRSSISSDWSALDDGLFEDDLDLSTGSKGSKELPPITHESPFGLVKRADGLVISSMTQLQNLSCRSNLHTASDMLRFNVPLYLATDSRSPLTDPNLEPFFKTFPCTFILSDLTQSSSLNQYQPVERFDRMMELVNRADGVPLGRLFLPFLEAIISAKASVTVGTLGSTFSGFAEGALHDAYALDARTQK